MNKTNKILIGIGVVALLLVFYVISGYNNFVSLNQDVNSKWSEVENQYQRQSDLIPNLVSIVSSSVKVETNFVEEVTSARTKWMESNSILEKDTAGVGMNNGIASFINAIATSENYPVLQANKQYVALTDEFSGTQNRISVARGRYIESVQGYNTATKRFPANIIAGMFNFNEVEYYKAESTQTPILGSGELP
jgi:LemA protein